MRAPAFWDGDGVWPHLLAPFSAITAAATARRVARPGWRAPVPVICCGNASVGGSGKTTLALDLGERLRARGVVVAFLTRGYRGSAREIFRVTPEHDAGDVGDEALLLAAVAPAYVGADRAMSARAAIGDGAGALIMDDGLQNPGLRKDLAFLVIDGAAGFGNTRLLPAGPLREPIAAASARCQAAVLIGPDERGVAQTLPGSLPILRASLRSKIDLSLGRLHAFAGIGRPEKFFASLRAAGANLVASTAFPDHHAYTGPEIARLRADAASEGAILVTTPKDHVRLSRSAATEIRAVGVSLLWDAQDEIDALLRRWVP